MKCASNTCTHEATGIISLNVPALDEPINRVQPIRVIIGLHLCTVCAATLKATEFLTSDRKMENVIWATARNQRWKYNPDFKQAFVSHIDYTSEEYKNLPSLEQP